MDKCVICGMVAEHEVREVTMGTMQTETIQVTGAPDADGTITITITSANVVGSPIAIPVEILDADAVGDVASKIQIAIYANEEITKVLSVSVATDTVTLTARTTEDNDGTLAFAFADTDTTGTTMGASTNGDDADAPLLGAIVLYCAGHTMNAVNDVKKQFNIFQKDYTQNKLIMSGVNGYIGEKE